MKEKIFDTLQHVILLIKKPFIPVMEWYEKQTKSIRYSIIACASLLLVCTLYMCSSSLLVSDYYDFKSSDDAIVRMRSYLHKMRDIKTSNTLQFTKDLKEWREMNDTVEKFIISDTTLQNPQYYIDEYRSIRDSTAREFMRLTETWKCTFEDVVNIKEQTTPFTTDTTITKIVTDAVPFFIGLDKSKKLDATSKDDAITLYRSFLDRYNKMGIHSKKQMLTFIQQEDIVFQNFLLHLYELDNDHIADITRTTEDVCNGIFSAAMKNEIPAEEALVFMAMRTNRRLLQNSSVCLADISRRKMKSRAQANAYLWMVIQPFISIDQFTMATMTAENRQQLQSIAKSLGKSQNFLRAFDVDPKSVSYLLPQQILKMYVMDV